jgi:hypothetical protein
MIVVNECIRLRCDCFNALILNRVAAGFLFTPERFAVSKDFFGV